jgi:hypothetical protein
LFFTGVGEVLFSVCRISHTSPTDSSSIYRTVAMLRLSDELNDTTGLLDLLLSKAADPAGADDQRDLRETALSEDLGVTEREEVEDGDGVLLLTLDVGVTGLLGNERPELVEVDDGLPEVGLLLVEVSHTNLSEVTGMVLVHVGTVVVLTTSKTTTTGMLAVLSDTSLTGGNVAAAEITSQSIKCSNILYVESISSGFVVEEQPPTKGDYCELQRSISTDSHNSENTEETDAVSLNDQPRRRRGG